MDYLKLKKAVAEAHRFIEAAEEIRVEDARLNIPPIYRTIPKGRKENAALRRASMDLSRALSALRGS